MNLLTSFKPIRLFVLDVDGVLTDGSLLVLEDGQMARRMNIKDGYALQLAVKMGYHILVISGGKSAPVKHRLSLLGIEDVHMGVTKKQELLAERVHALGLSWNEVLYMGDDIPDLKPMQMAGLACCPKDAVNEIRALSHYISPLEGGKGCVRDVIEKVLKLNGHWMVDEDIPSK